MRLAPDYAGNAFPKLKSLQLSKSDPNNVFALQIEPLPNNGMDIGRNWIQCQICLLQISLRVSIRDVRNTHLSHWCNCHQYFLPPRKIENCFYVEARDPLYIILLLFLLVRPSIYLA